MRKFFGLGSSTPSTPPAPPVPAAAASDLKSTIVGRWKEPRGNDVTEFRADGSVLEKPAAGESIRGRYTVEGAKVKITLEGVPEPVLFLASRKGESLEMTGPDGLTTRYEKAA